MSLLSSIVLLLVGYVLLRLIGMQHDGDGGVQRRVVDVGAIAADLGVVAADGLRGFVRVLVALWTILRPYAIRLADPSLWRGTQDAVVNGVRLLFVAAHNSASTARPSQFNRSVPRATVSDDFDWTQVTDYAASEINRMPALVEVERETRFVHLPARSTESTVSECPACPSHCTSVPFLMGDRLAEGSGSSTVLPSGVNVCASGRPTLHLAETTSWYAIIVGREPGCYYSWHIAGPQVLGCAGQSYRAFRTEDAAVDYYTDQLMLGKVTKVVAPPYVG